MRSSRMEEISAEPAACWEEEALNLRLATCTIGSEVFVTCRNRNAKCT